MPFLYIIFQPYQCFKPPSSTPEGDRQMHSLTFCTQQLLFKAFFSITDIFSVIHNHCINIVVYGIFFFCLSKLISSLSQKTSYVSNFALLFYCMNGSMADAPTIKTPLCVIPISSLKVYYWSFSKWCVCPLSGHLCSKVKNT